MSFKTVRLFNVFNAPITFIDSQQDFKDRNLERKKKTKMKFSIQNSSEFLEYLQTKRQQISGNKKTILS